ncbi:helix-turn-helix domain-containing protein [Scatolibacter rhodanostii]|uniref:helix-turn-helix domain-containing protein n=1 Tax=Scatolibacter rhodanostii TaxID=2014781 RepID=UPI001FA879BA|nr:AraC family transcriptional regulator [Scatolibacter rhodanostii]
MEIALDRLIKHFAEIPFKLEGVYHYTIKPEMSGRENTAPFPGFIFPVRGKARYHFNATPYVAKPGSVIMGGADMQLDKQVLDGKEWEYVCVLYRVFGQENSDISLSHLHTELKIGQSVQLSELLHRLIQVSAKPGVVSAFQQETLFHCILEEAFRCAKSQNESSGKGLFERISEHIQSNHANEISVKELARQYGISENQLYYVFQKQVGMSVGQYLSGYRLDRAKQLLKTTEMPVREVAAAVGYVDALYFSRVFRQKFGVSPSEMRRIQE